MSCTNKDLFIGAIQIKTDFETRYSGKKKFVTLIMPILILWMRIEMEVVFKNSYPLFFSDSSNEQIAMKQINEIITKILDPNLFWSRFSFFESDKEAISLKFLQRNKGSNLPALKAMYNSRSTMIETLIPVPSEGKIRKMFMNYHSPSATKFPKVHNLDHSKSTANLTETIRTGFAKRGKFYKPYFIIMFRIVFSFFNFFSHSIWLSR